MKSMTSMYELIIIIVFMMCSVPLILMLVRQADTSEFNYLDDKSSINLQDSIVFDEDGVPQGYCAIQFDIGTAIAIPIVNDDYCPAQGRWVDYYFDSKVRNYTQNEYESWCTSKSISLGSGEDNMIDSTLYIVDSWESEKNDAFSDLLNSVGVPSMVNGYKNKVLNLYWNGNLDRWLITTENFNIMPEKEAEFGR